jgi:hypothetical protein
MNQRHGESRMGAISAVSGAILLSMGTYLHPLQADPNDARAAFAEYAADHLWVVSHLIQWLGIVLILGAFILLSRRMANGPAAEWAYVGMAGAVGCLATASVLQAVDGIALKVMVDAWTAASGNEKAILFQAAFGTRQIEVALASIVTLLIGVTVSVYGIALALVRCSPKWLGLLGIIEGIMLMTAGVVIAYTGFSDIAMILSMPSNVLLLVWVIILGVSMWPREKKTAGSISV